MDAETDQIFLQPHEFKIKNKLTMMDKKLGSCQSFIKYSVKWNTLCSLLQSI